MTVENHAAAPASLRLSGIYKRFGELTALDDVS